MDKILTPDSFLISSQVDWDTVRLTLSDRKTVVTFEATKEFEWDNFIKFLQNSSKFNSSYPYDWKFGSLAVSLPIELRAEQMEVPQGASIKETRANIFNFDKDHQEYLRKFAANELAKFHWNRIHNKNQK